MLAELTNDEGKAGKASGKVLFFSTLGSVAGGIVTPVWLFPSIGVAHSTFVVCGLLSAAAVMMAIGHFHALKAIGAAVAAMILVISVSAMAAANNDLFHFDSAYQTIRIVEEKDDGPPLRVMVVSGGRASGVYAESGETAFPYTRLAAKLVEETKARNVLVIGATGFTLPRDAAVLPLVQHVDAVDIDPAVKDIAESQFLRHPLPGNVRFVPLSARYAMRKLRKEGRHYDFTFIDAYFGRGIPDELATVEFFEDVRRISERTSANAILDRTLASEFARNLLATFRRVFGHVWVRAVKPGESETANIMLTSWPAPESVEWNGPGHAYRDDSNTADRDHVRLIWGVGERP